MAIYILIGIAAFWVIELIDWSINKYLMLDRLWIWHKNHDLRDNKKSQMSMNIESKHFEKNDRFFIMYATHAIIVMIVGYALYYPSLVTLGIGITAYGMTYFLIHDVIIHQRLPLPFLLKNENRYITAIRITYLAHYHPITKTDFHNYGLLIFPSKFFKD